jgi:tripartite-type tricarboxylate transporter receptor subunit TctC
VCQIARVPLVAVVPVSLPVKTMKDFVELARASPGKLNYASTGKGALNQLVAESLKVDAKIDVAHIPYKGGGPAIQAVMTGEAQIYFSSFAGVKGLVSGGKLRIIATTGSTRSAEIPNVPTAKESGFPGIEAYDWFGILAPAATPPGTIEKLNQAVVDSLKVPEIRAKLVDLGYEIVGGTPSEFDALIKADHARWSRRAAEAKIQFEE